MKTKHFTIKLSTKEIDYVQGLLASYRQRLELERSPKSGSLLTQEIDRALKIEQKLVSA